MRMTQTTPEGCVTALRLPVDAWDLVAMALASGERFPEAWPAAAVSALRGAVIELRDRIERLRTVAPAAAEATCSPDFRCLEAHLGLDARVAG